MPRSSNIYELSSCDLLLTTCPTSNARFVYSSPFWLGRRFSFTFRNSETALLGPFFGERATTLQSVSLSRV